MGWGRGRVRGGGGVGWEGEGVGERVEGEKSGLVKGGVERYGVG